MELTLHSSRHGEVEKAWPSLRGPAGLLLGGHPQQALQPRRKKQCPSCPRAYLESPDPVYDFFNKVRGSLPVVGLLSRIFSDDGGIGSDRIYFKEFCMRVYRNFSSETSLLFIDFGSRHGSAARPQYVLLWCWAAALGAGLLKSEDMMTGATRLRATYDIIYEEETLSLLMDEAQKKRQKFDTKAPFVPYEARAEKALDAILKCCIGRMYIDEEDAVLLTGMLQGVFPGADKEEIARLVRSKIGPVKEDLETFDEERDSDVENDEIRQLHLSEERLESLREQKDKIGLALHEEQSSGRL